MRLLVARALWDTCDVLIHGEVGPARGESQVPRPRGPAVDDKVCAAETAHRAEGAASESGRRRCSEIADAAIVIGATACPAASRRPVVTHRTRCSSTDAGRHLCSVLVRAHLRAMAWRRMRPTKSSREKWAPKLDAILGATQRASRHTWLLCSCPLSTKTPVAIMGIRCLCDPV